MKLALFGVGLILMNLMIPFEMAAYAAPSCPNLSGEYEASYVIMGEQYHLVSKVTQTDCSSMTAENVVTSIHGTQGYTRTWIADGIFRRKDAYTVESAVFTSTALVTTEVRSPVNTAVPGGPQAYFSRKDSVYLDPNKNLMNAEERFNEQGVRVGSDQFLYKRR